MPTLIIARHAKAEAPAPGLQDLARTLALIGRKASTKLGQEIAAAGLAPELAIVSPSTRTQQTWKLMSSALAGCRMQTEQAIYETDVDGLVGVVREIDGVDTAVMVGHEPTSSAATAFLAGPGSDTDALKNIAHGLSTATAAVLEFDGDWADLGSRTARLTAVISGRDVE
ncbi:histidine phosphatase family protein [uncultured Demequina sp.]|uniref:SixA phosphatase family protein n=1 Tax=uncultured Demequina sp. TaxID=693499 RepID=UPI0025D907A1|nr:histidine phosphatase family protein [uncultured Demequina sp.]